MGDTRRKRALAGRSIVPEECQPGMAQKRQVVDPNFEDRQSKTATKTATGL